MKMNPGNAASLPGSGKTQGQAELLFNRLSKRYRHLKKWARRAGTDAYRLYDRDIPEIPLVLDFYNGAVSGALYQRPYEKDEDEENRWLRAMAASVSEALGISEDHIFLKQRRRLRRRQEGSAQYGPMGKEHFYRDVHEEDLVFRVNLSGYLDTGLFLDARKRRALVRSEAAGKRVLNLFAYTCSFSVAAAAGGAREIDSVDLSNTYLKWGKVNFALNGLDAENGPASSFRFINADAFQFLEQVRAKRRFWDLVILDPPSFSNSKKMRTSLDIRRDYRDLINLSLTLLSPGGRLWFSSNAKGFRLESGDFPGIAIRDMGPGSTDEDFRGKKTPAVYTLTRK
jgi:23S rRNA G2069 N7-methylase RlmK/C1962 C5-methylase RlmI